MRIRINGEEYLRKSREGFPWEELEDLGDFFEILLDESEVEAKYQAPVIRTIGGQWARRRKPTPWAFSVKTESPRKIKVTRVD